MRIHAVVVSLALAALAAGQESKISRFEFTGPSIGGQTFDQDSFKGNVLLVDLWGTWCPPCRKAVPVLVKLYEKYKHHGLEIVGFCYDRNGGGEDLDKVRAFAIENRITYPLVIGTPAVREQIRGFNGYPTLLLFGRDLAHRDTHVGFGDGTEKDLEAKIRLALGLDEPAAGEGGEAGEAAAKPEPKETVPTGKIFEPGNGAHGFELEGEDVAGEKFRFADWQGKPVLLAITTSWDQEAERTSKLLRELGKNHEGLRVVAWHIERESDPTKKDAVVREFLERQGASYRAFTTNIATARDKVHRFASLPTLLLFDRDGVLVARENGIADAIEDRIRAATKRLFE